MTFQQLAIPIVWSAFTLWTIHKLWRPQTNATAANFDATAKAYCLGMTALAAFVLPLIMTFPGVPYWIAAIVLAIVAFPVCSWAGYAFSVGVRWFDR
jgi:hypothetical protein